MFELFRALSKGPRPSRSDPPSTTGKRSGTSSIGGTASRKQLLAVVLKETLLRNGVPAGSVGIEFFRTLDRSGTRTDGIHVRLLVREEQADLSARMLAIERDFRRRLLLVDYRAFEWLQGISWQFDLPEEDPLADAGTAPAAKAAAPHAAKKPRNQDTRGFTYASTEPAPL